MTQLQLRSFDIPALHKFGIGFDRMFDEIMRTTEQTTNYPPYNIVEHTEDKYTIELAVAGFRDGEIEITVDNRSLTVKGNKISQQIETKTKTIHQGISHRAFTRNWTLAEYVEVTSAEQENGILTITLERMVPEHKKPKSVAINFVK